MSLNEIGLVFWAAGFAGHVVLLTVLLVRHRAKAFPFFTALIGSDVLKTAILFLVRRNGNDRAYLWAYLVLALVDVVLQCAVVGEVAWKVFRPLGQWAPDIRGGLIFLATGSLVVASGLTLMATSESSKWQLVALGKANFFSSVLFAELFIGMVVLSVMVGLPWRTHIARIAYGLGVYATLTILIEAGHTLYGGLYGARVGDVLISARQGLYLCVLGYWIVTLWQEAPEPREMGSEMREQLQKLQQRLAYDLYTVRPWRKP